MPSSPGWSRSVRELRTHVIRSSSWRRSFTLTDTWPGEDASRLLTLSVCQNGKSKSGSRTAEWSTKRTTSCPTRRTCVARPIPPASRPSSLLKRRSPMLRAARRPRWRRIHRRHEGAVRPDRWAGHRRPSTAWIHLWTNSNSSSTFTAETVFTRNCTSTTST